MDKPLYILIFLLLWSIRIRGGKEEDINGTLSPSTQTSGVRNSLIDKESSETESPPIKSKTLQTNTGTVRPSVPNSITPKPAKESTRKNMTKLSDIDSDSSEAQSPSNKPEVPQTTNDLSETNSPPFKLEETETKPGASEIFLPNSVTIKPARDSTTVNTTESDPDSASKKAKTTPARDLDSEPPETDSTSIKSEAPETEFAPTKTKTTAIRYLESEPSETDSTSIKSEALKTVIGKSNYTIGTQQPSFHNFESHELADESSETDSSPFKSVAPEINPDNPDPSIPNSETLGPSKELLDTEFPPYISEATESRTEKSDRELPPRHTRTSRATKESSKTNSPPNQRNAAKATTSKDPQSTTNVDEEITTTEVQHLNCSSNQSAYFKSQTNSSITLTLSPFGNHFQLCVLKWPESNVSQCVLSKSSSDITIDRLDPGRAYKFPVYILKNNKSYLNESCTIGPYYTSPDIPVCSQDMVSKKTTTSMLLDLKNLNTTGAESFIAEIFHEDSESKEINLTKRNNYLVNITNLTQGTAYTLRIFAVSEHNIRSTDSCQLQTVYTYPGQPRKDNYTVNSDSLQFSWKPPNGNFDTYNLTVHCHCSCCSCPKNYSRSESKSVTTKNVTNLKPGTYCSVNITAISGGLSSIPLEFYNIETTEIAPGEVSDVMVTDINNNSFTISWSKPLMPNGDLINYTINLFHPAKSINVSISSPSTSIENLQPGVCYNVTVAAVNKIGEGKRKFKTVYTRETVPSNVTNIVTLNTSSTSIAVSWSKPHNPNGVIRGYQIFVWKTNEQVEGNNLKQIITLTCESCQRPCNTTLSQDNPQNSRPPYVNKGKDETTTIHEVSFTESNTTLHYEVTGLEIFTSYSFNVTAFTSVGHGGWATNVKKTSEDIPSNVTDLKSSNTSSTSIAVTWSKPNKPNGVIRKYQIFVKKINEQGNNLRQIILFKCDCCQGPCPTAVPQDRLKESSPPYEIKEKDEKTSIHEVSFTESNTTLHYEVTGLEIFTLYSFNVTAFTSVGHGGWATNVKKTSEDIPSNVTDLTSWNTSSTSIAVTWSKPNKPNGVIREYQIFVKKTNEQGNNLRQIIRLQCDCCQGPCPTTVLQDRGKEQKTSIHEVSFTESNTTLHYEVTGLEIFTLYSFNVTAFTSVGHGNWTTSVKRTSEDIPSNVTDLTSWNTSSTSIAVTWSKPDDPNGVIREYQIFVKKTNEQWNNTRQIITLKCDCCQLPCPTTMFQDRGKDQKTGIHEVSFTESNTTLHYEVTGLEIFTSYSFNVTAFTSVGHGGWATNVKKTSEDIPSSVTNLTSSNTSSTSIAVTWSKPDDPNGVIRMYQIFVKKKNKEEGNNLKQIITLKCDCCQGSCPSAVPEDKLQELDPPDENKEKDEKTSIHEVSFTESNTTLHYEVTGLEIFTLYSFNVTAFTSVGHGNWTTKVKRTSEDKPFPPGHPVKSNVQINSLSFVYDKPEKENGVITNQEIEYSYKPYNVCAENSEYEHTVTKTNISGIIDNGDKFNAYLGDLQPFWWYTIRVRVSTYAGFSNYSQPTTIRTLPTTPGKVSNIIAAQTYSRHIELKWTQPCHPNGLIINYHIDIWNKNHSSHNTTQTNSSITGLNVTSLLPYCLYNFTVFTEVQNVLNLSEPTTSTLFRTKAEAPYRPGRFTEKSNTSTSVTLSWETPKRKTGPTKYIVEAIDNVTFALGGSCETLGFHNTTCNITGLDSYWNYLLTVEAIVENFPANKSIDYDGVRTAESAPGRVSHFTVTQDSNVTAKTNVLIEWSPPSKRDLNGIIKNYFLQYWYQSNQIKTNSYNSTESEATIYVEAEKMYTFQIFAMTNANATDIVTKSLPIKPGAPLPPPSQEFPLINKGPPASDDQTQIAVAFRRIALCDDSNGKIVKWYIIVSKTPERQVFRGTKNEYLKKIEKSYKKWEDVYEKDVTEPYIASDSWIPHCVPGSRRKRSAPVETVSYTLGSDGDCESGNRKYCNGNLEPGQTYRVRYAVCTAGGCLESEFSEPFQTAPNHVPAIAGSLTAVVLVLVVIIVVIIILKRRGKGPFKSLDNGDVGQQNEAFSGVEMKGTSKPKAVKIADFANYVQKLHADSNLLFSSEYKLLKETCPTHTTKAAEVQVNRIKNRYTNILSYDHSRVKLLPTEDDEGSDYINANYMPGYSSPREYIATQGPLPFTRDDFWRMVWEQNVSIIVMLTQLVERGRRKCDIYWPEAAREPVYYGDLVVELESESTLPDYVLRVMSIKLGNRVRKVKQLHYLKWPDMGCPETTWLLLNFVGATRLYLPHNDPGPIVVHCSAGVGRTGTFIAVDYLMQHVRTSDVIDIYNYVMKMRNNRPNMVQTEDQYVFIHDCIKDYVNKNDDDTDDEEEEEEKQEDQSIYMNV